VFIFLKATQQPSVCPFIPSFARLSGGFAAVDPAVNRRHCAANASYVRLSAGVGSCRQTFRHLRNLLQIGWVRRQHRGNLSIFCGLNAIAVGEPELYCQVKALKGRPTLKHSRTVYAETEIRPVIWLNFS